MDHTVSPERLFTVWRALLLLVTLYLCSSEPKAEEAITIKDKIAVKDEGSCVTINCTYNSEENMELLWVKDPVWDAKNKMFKGTIVHSNAIERPSFPEYSSRVEFLGDSNITERTSCTLRMNNLRMNDSGNYNFRFINGDTKFMSEPMHLTVKANPCKVHLSPLKKSYKEGEPVILQCTTSAECPDYPVWGTLSSSETSREEKADTNTGKVNKLQLNMTWKDHGRNLSCRPSNSLDDCQSRHITLTVEYAPKETQIITSHTDVKEGESITLHCSTYAHPAASYTWFKDEDSLNQLSSEYKLHQAKLEDSGSYRCEASNSLGKGVSSSAIDVKYAPKDVNVVAESSEVKEGDELNLTCVVQKSNPDQWIKYSWYQNDTELKEYSNQSIYFPSIKQRQGGQYHCQASNIIGSTKSHPFVISVKYAPGRTNITGAQKIKLDSALNLHCETFANPQPDVYFWYHKSEVGQKYVIHSNNKSQYHIEKVAVSDSGWYLCSPRNSIGTGRNSTEFQVHVLYPPRKVTLDMPTTVREAENLTISCTVESYPEANITLSRTHSNSEVKANRSQSNNVTFFSIASRSHAGLYTCKAENSEGKNFTKQRLKVFYAPKDLQTYVSSEKHEEGKSLTLTCEAHSEPNVTRYTWKKQSRTPAETVREGPHLNIHSLNKSDSGNYFCTASNEVGTSTSATVLIKVQYRPYLKIIHNLTSLYEWDGRSPVQLTCSADCYPAASRYEWHKKNQDNVTVMSTNQNYIVQPQNPGIYYCTAGNDIGNSASETISLSVNRSVGQMLLLLIPVVFCLLIVFMFLLYRTILRKRSSDGADSQLFFFEASNNNTRENLVVMEPSGTTTAPPYSSTSRDMSGRLAANMQTVYDLVRPSQIKQDGPPHTEEDLDMTSVNYTNLPVKGCNDPTASTDGAVYAVVSKNKENKKVVPSGNEDYENISGACAPKLDFSKILWVSDSSEEEEEVNYTKVAFTAKPHHKPPRSGADSSSDDQDRIEYSQIKI